VLPLTMVIGSVYLGALSFLCCCICSSSCLFKQSLEELPPIEYQYYCARPEANLYSVVRHPPQKLSIPLVSPCAIPLHHAAQPLSVKAKSMDITNPLYVSR